MTRHTHQESLDLSSLALIAQGRPGYDASAEKCRYALGCAAAHLMPPDADLAKFDMLDVSANRTGPAAALRAAGHDPDFVVELQLVHDRSARRSDGALEWRVDWLREVCRFATKRGLSNDRIVEAARAAGWEVES